MFYLVSLILDCRSQIEKSDRQVLRPAYSGIVDQVANINDAHYQASTLAGISNLKSQMRLMSCLELEEWRSDYQRE